MFKITADNFSQSKHYYVMTLMVFKPVLMVFCFLGVKWWTVIFTVCLQLKWFLTNPTTVLCSWSQQREHKLVQKMLFPWFWRMTLMVLCAGSKQERVLLVYTYEILMAKTKAKSPNIKCWLVMYPKISCKHTYKHAIQAHLWVFVNANIHTESLYKQKKNLKTHVPLSWSSFVLTF